MSGSILCLLLLVGTRSRAGVVFGPEEELMLVVSGILAVAASRGAMVVVVVAMALTIGLSDVAVAFRGSNASPCTAGGNLHLRCSQPTFEQ